VELFVKERYFGSEVYCAATLRNRIEMRTRRRVARQMAVSQKRLFCAYAMNAAGTITELSCYCDLSMKATIEAFRQTNVVQDRSYGQNFAVMRILSPFSEERRK
jgi:hypothetical protein